MARTSTILVALSASVVLVGCNNIPDYRQGGFSNPFVNPFATDRPAPLEPSAPLVPEASAAEAACLEAGRAAGFDVQGVVGTQEVLGSGGLPQSRDVMLRIDRGGQSVEVRCSYAYVDGSAQIMTL